MLVLLGIFWSAVRFVSVQADPTIQLGNTTLVGRSIPTFQQEFFGGIPFAEPPLGSLRLSPPVLKSSLDSDTFNATNYGPACLQTDLPINELSEDCLTINILRTAGIPSTVKLPVMFWTYGGGFDEGASVIYNGSGIVAQSALRGTPVIFVNYNYRLGPLGFPQGQEADSKGSLNLGLKDQLAALKWVQLNIETFGGDKDKVTVFGEGALFIFLILRLNVQNGRIRGSDNDFSPVFELPHSQHWLEQLCAHPLSPSLPHQNDISQILESGSQGTTALFTSERREAAWQNFVGGVASCASIATSGSTFGCLQDANTTEIFAGLAAAAAEATEEFPWDPVIDGSDGLIPDLPSVLFQRGQFARLPFIAGTNLDEGTLFTPQTINSTEEINATTIAQFVPSVSLTRLESSVQTLLELYPDDPALGSPFNTGNNTFGLSSQYKRAAAIDGDISFHSQRRFWIETAANASVPTFGYLFTQPQLPTVVPPALGVSHGSEVNYVFGAPNDTSASAVFISRIMTDYWVSFATSLTPNDGLGVPRPEWTQYTPDNKAVIQLNGANLTMIPDDFRAEQIAFINSDPVIWRH